MVCYEPQEELVKLERQWKLVMNLLKGKENKGYPIYIYFLKTQISIKICTLQFIILSIKVNQLLLHFLNFDNENSK